jgi:hypothetical protein
MWRARSDVDKNRNARMASSIKTVVKTLHQTQKQFYSIHEGLKVAEGLFALLKRSHDDGSSKLVLGSSDTEEQLNHAKSALKTAIQLTRPVGLASRDAKAGGKRILSTDVNLKTIAEGLKCAETVLDEVDARVNRGTLLLHDSAIEFGNTELVFTAAEYIAFAKRALTDAVQKAESEILGPEVSIVNERVLDNRPAWERQLIDRAFPLGRLIDPAVRRKVKNAKLVFGFDVTEEFKGLVFFGKAYFMESVEQKRAIPADQTVAFTYQIELGGHLKLAVAVQVLKGSCDIL